MWSCKECNAINDDDQGVCYACLAENHSLTQSPFASSESIDPAADYEAATTEIAEEPVAPAKNKKGMAAIAAVVLALLSKFKGVLFLVLTKFKFMFILLKLAKFGTTALSMVATIAIYAWAFGFWYAVGFVALLFVHETGHYMTAKKVGLAVSGPVFIPFVGAFIGMKEAPKDAVTEAKVGYGGPLWGTAAALITLGIYFVTESELAAALAYTGFFLNLFNLIPVHPLDGGRVVTAISPYLWLVGLPVLGYLVFTSFNPILLMIVVLGSIQAYKLWKDKDNEYYNIPGKTKAYFAFLYFGLVSVLGAGIWYTLGLIGK